MANSFKEVLKSRKTKCERLIEYVPQFHTVSSDTKAYAASVDLIYSPRFTDTPAPKFINTVSMDIQKYG